MVLLLKYRYLVLFPLAAFEGPIVSLIVGFLIFSGVLNFWPSFIIMIFGDIIPDTIYYYLGFFAGTREFVQKRIIRSAFFIEHLDIIKKLWTEHTRKTMFFSKLAYGLAVPFIVSAGIVKLPYRKFIAYAIPVTIFQYGVIMFIGYHMGNSYKLATQYIHDAYLFMALIVIIFIIVYMGVIKYARNKIISMKEKGQ